MSENTATLAAVQEGREWVFRVKCAVDHADYSVYVTGDCDTLGNWRVQTALKMENDGEDNWTSSALLPVRDVRYRYCIMCPDTTLEDKKLMVCKWETNLEPRIAPAVPVANGTCNGNRTMCEEFGHFGDVVKVEDGWLTFETTVQLMVKEAGVEFSAEEPDAVYSLKITPLLRKNTFKNKNSDQISQKLPKKKEAGPVMRISQLAKDSGYFQNQREFGSILEQDDVTIFQTRFYIDDTVGFFFEVFKKVGDGWLGHACGHIFYPKNLPNTKGVSIVPVFLKGTQDQEFFGTIPEIGHRGNGVSYNDTPLDSKVRENTIRSLHRAGEHGADLVEFDVQLSKDMVPIVYHNFQLLLDIQSKESKKYTKMRVDFHSLTFEEFNKLKLYHVKENENEKVFDDNELEDHQPFPSLEKVLKSIDVDIGFNVEIKYPQEGGNELKHPIDINEYVDTILKVIYEHGGQRYIVFSSFSSDTCLALRLKQNKYPVMVLTQEPTQQPPYSDPRTLSALRAVNFANGCDLLGLVVHASELLYNKNIVEHILANNLVLFCWGEPVNDYENKEILKKLGVRGVIFDCFDQLNSKLEKKGIFKKEQFSML